MDKFVEANLAFIETVSKPETTQSEYAKAITSLHAAIKKTSTSALQKKGPGGEEVLNVLRPDVHSLGYLYVLNARADTKAGEALWDDMSEFLETFDARQIAHDADALKKLVHHYTAAVSSKPILAVRSLKHAIRRLTASNPHLLTVLHLPFVEACLYSKSYRAAQSVIESDIQDLPPAGDGDIKVTELLKYFLYAGMLCLGLKKWRKAMDYFTACIVVPGHSFSKIQVEAYKKYLLASLLNSGTGCKIPKLVDRRIAGAIQKLCLPYELFSDIYESGDAERLAAELPQFLSVFRADGNGGLVGQVLLAFRKFRIVALTHTYVTLSMSYILAKGDNYKIEQATVTRRTPNEADVEKGILEMIEDGLIDATISQSHNSSSTVRFLDSSSLSADAEAANLAELADQIARTINLTNNAKALSRKIGLEKEYILAMKQKGSGSGQGGYGVYGGRMDMDDPMENVFYVEGQGDDMMDDADW